MGQIALIAYLYSCKENAGIDDEQFNEALQSGELQLLEPNMNLFLAILLLGFAVAAIFFLSSVKFIHKKPILSLFTSRSRFDWKRFLTGALLWIFTACVLIFLLLPKDKYTYQFDLVKFVPLAAIALTLVPVQACLEEVFFRGYLLQGVYLIVKHSFVAWLLVTVLFASMHLANPEIQSGFWPILGVYFVFSSMLGITAVLDEGLEIPCGIHTANNLFTALILSTSNGAMNTDSIFQTRVEHLMGILPPLLLILSIFTLVALAFYYRWNMAKLFAVANR